jgi:hypothetical protein
VKGDVHKLWLRIYPPHVDFERTDIGTLPVVEMGRTDSMAFSGLYNPSFGSGEYLFLVDGLDAVGQPLPGNALTVDHSGPTSLENAEPLRTALFANAPNPARGFTVFRFALVEAQDIRLDILDPGGRTVRTVVEGRHKAGRHAAFWDGRDGLGRQVPAGVYLFRLQAGGKSLWRKLLLTR